ncbi:MAG: membrane protein insertase YidC, partial [Kiritimatiellae bacterium]|nr:membrane protein insertase YidC [Kiritimatiellia bacterium]
VADNGAAPGPAAPAASEPAGELPPPAGTVFTTLENGDLRVTLSSFGGGVSRAEMAKYPMTGDAGSGPVAFDFSERPAGMLLVSGARLAFTLAESSARRAVYRATAPDGGEWVRTVTLAENGYELTFADEVRNGTGAPLAASVSYAAGWMHDLPGDKSDRAPTLGFDTLSESSVDHWATKLEKWFPLSTSPAQSRVVPDAKKAVQAEWFAVKDKYFAEILSCTDPVPYAETVTAFGRRGEPRTVRSMLFFRRTETPLAAIAGEMRLPGAEVAAGDGALFGCSLYIGPKHYATLKATGAHREETLELGFWRPIGLGLLWLMLRFKEYVPPFNYGISIILLTVFIRLVFWPLNHKSMSSTQKMQDVQPLVNAAKEKYKNDPQKQQAAMMAIYKEHGINPMGGCLPMLVQIPVFFALFIVLRGAIELRFSRFLWIADLSRPENLFSSVVPFGVNFLPILMGVTMWLQQKMTPTSDPQQQKMMAFMPILFTVLFYAFPSGLSLYWTTNQVLMIAQLAWMRRKRAKAAAAAAAKQEGKK